MTQRWVAIIKPAGWLTIPGRSDKGPPVLSEWAKNLTPVWVVHRLDLETSGVVLFARTAQDHQEANLWFQQKRMKKTYHCFAAGTPRAPMMKLKGLVQGSLCTTQVEVCESYWCGFFARVSPLSGKRHQIRVHLSTHGYPIFGDQRYGGPQKVFGPQGGGQSVNREIVFERVALHASALQLPTGEIFEASFPKDFSNWLNHLRMATQNGS